MHLAALIMQDERQRQRALLVDQAVRECLEEGIGGVILHQYPLAHGQGLSCGCCYHITLAWIDEHLDTKDIGK